MADKTPKEMEAMLGDIWKLVDKWKHRYDDPNASVMPWSAYDVVSEIYTMFTRDAGVDNG